MRRLDVDLVEEALITEAASEEVAEAPDLEDIVAERWFLQRSVWLVVMVDLIKEVMALRTGYKRGSDDVSDDIQKAGVRC